MITDALNTKGELAFVYERFAARISGDSTPPTTESLVSETILPVEVSQSAGGQELDFAQLVSIGETALIDRTQPVNFSRMVDVLLPNKDRVRIHLGDYVQETETVNSRNEQLTVQSHLRPYHFGDPMQGEQWQFSSLGGDVRYVKRDITFNPNIDGEVLGNMSSEEREDGLANLWIHPQSVRTTKAETYGGQTASKWTIKEAIKALTIACNLDEEFILNPTDFTPLDDAPTVENVRMKRGLYLPDYLDQLLHPLGFNWYVDYGTKKGWKKDKPEIKLFQKGVGTEKQIYHLAPDSTLNLEDHNCDAYTISRNIGDHYNAVRVLGAFDQMEVSVYLEKSWSEDDDSLTAADLKRSDESSSYAANPTVWRLWTANEAGDLVGLRTDIPVSPEFEVNLVDTDRFETAVRRRRRAMPPLTYQGGAGDKTRRDVVLRAYAAEGGAWTTFTGTFAVLPDQLGVVITDDVISSDIMGAKYLQMTCTIEGDSRVEGVAEREAHAVNGREVWLELDMPQKFARRWVLTSDSDHQSYLAGNPAGADEVDDETAIQDYAEALLEQGGFAEVDCEFVLPGIHTYYEIGDLITKVEGREISLDAASAAAPSPVYPQVTKRVWRYDEQGGPETVLTLDRGAAATEQKPIVD